MFVKVLGKTIVQVIYKDQKLIIHAQITVMVQLNVSGYLILLTSYKSIDTRGYSFDTKAM